MAATDISLKAKIELDAAAAAKSINDLNSQIKETKKVLNDAKIGSDEHKTALSQLSAQQQQLKQATDATNASHKQSTEAFGALKEKVTALVPGLKGVEAGSHSVGTAFKALAANPIILMVTGLVAVLKFLYESFTASREGAEKVERVFAGVSAAVQVVVDRVFKLGNAIIKFFSGDFKGAAADAKGAFTGIGAEIEDKVGRTVQLKAKLQEIKKAELADALDKSVRVANLAKLKAMMNDEEVSAKEKIKIGKELMAAAKKNSEEDIKRTRETVMTKIALIKMEANWQKDHLEEVNNLNIQLNTVIAEGANEEKAIGKQIKASQRQDDAEAKQRSDEAKAKAKEANEAAKQRRKELMDYNVKVQKQEQEIELLQLKDGKEKELRVLDTKIHDEKKANKAAREDGKLSKQQEAQLNLNLDKMYAVQRDQIEDKHRKIKKEKEIEFREELNKVILETQLAGIENAREREKKQLDITYDEKQKQAVKKYQDNEAALFQISIAISIQRKQAEKALDKKFEAEDQKSAQALSLRRIAFESSLAKNNLNLQKKLLDDKQAIIVQQYTDEIAAAEGNAQKLADIEQRRTESNHAYSEANKAIAKGESDARIQALDAVGATLDNAANLIGKATLTGKILGIASATISTFTSAQKAYESTIGIPFVGPVLAPINAGLAVAAGLKNIKRIASVQIPGNSGGNAPAISLAGAPLAPAPIQTSTSLNQSSINGIGNAAQGGVGRSYILDSEINSNAERQNRIQRAARIS